MLLINYHMRVTLAALPWKRNGLLVDSSSCWIPKASEVCLTGKIDFDEIDISPFGPSGFPVIFLTIPIQSYLVDGLHKFLKFNQSRWIQFRENFHFMLWRPFERFVSLKLGRSYSLDTDPWWINSWMPNRNKILSTVQALACHAHIHPHIQTQIYDHADVIPKTTFSYSGDQNM
jgi:hypothetical protein